MRDGTLEALSAITDARTPKHGGARSHRTAPPEETWHKIAPWLPRAGITRVANVTGLDHIGIPVWQAIRPNSRSLSVSQGKGADSMSAKVSAVMESLETWCAEHAHCDLRLAPYAEVAAEGAADPRALPLARQGGYADGTAILWTRGFDLVGRRPMWVPFELVHANTTVAGMTFCRTTNGLASGNTLAEATLHALCELVERDAHALWKLRSPEAQAATRVDLAGTTHPWVRRLLDLYAAAGIVPLVWNMTSDVGIAALRVIAFDADTDALMNPMAAAYGAGCDLDRVTALVRGLTEAAQSRLSWIAGSRDDLDRSASYDALQRAAVLEEYRALAAQSGAAALEAVPTRGEETVEQDVSAVLAQLRAAGIEHAIVVPLPYDELPVAVARVIVPGLEGTSAAPQYKRGRRALAVSP
jgi:ribosomal protein S12 methylthiotransferase accessory factor